MTTTTRDTYRATVTRDGRFWLIRIPRVGATQARHLAEVDTMARDLVSVMTGASPDTFDLDVQVRLPADTQARLRRMQALRNQSARANAEAAEEARAAARSLHDAGLSLRDVGAALGVSHQRAHQLVS